MMTHPHVSAVIHGDGLTVMQWRVAKGRNMRDPEDEIFSKEKMSYTVQPSAKRNRIYNARRSQGGKTTNCWRSYHEKHAPECLLRPVCMRTQS